MSRLELLLLGPPRIERETRPMAVDTRKAIALIAYLVWTKILRSVWLEIQEAQRRAEAQRAAELAAAHAHEPGAPGVDYDTKLQQARDLARADPRVVANVIKEWVGGSEPR